MNSYPLIGSGDTIKSRVIFISAILLICTIPLDSGAESAQVTSTGKDTLAIQWHGTVNPSDRDVKPSSEHCITNDGAMYGMLRLSTTSTDTGSRALPDMTVFPYESGSSNHGQLYRFANNATLDWTIDLNHSVNFRNSAQPDLARPLEYNDGKSTLICDVDEEGNLYLVGKRIVFPSNLEEWDAKWENDFHVAKISPQGQVLSHQVLGLSNIKHRSVPIDLYIDHDSNEIVVLGVYCLSQEDKHTPSGCDSGLPGIAEPPIPVHPSSSQWNYSNYSLNGAPVVVKFDSDLNILGHESVELRCRHHHFTRDDYCNAWMGQILGENKSGDYWLAFNEATRYISPPNNNQLKDPFNGKGCTSDLEIIISIVQDMSNWNASICSNDIFAQASVVYSAERKLLDSTLDQLIVVDHRYVQKLNLSGLSGNIDSNNATTYFNSQRECYLYSSGFSSLSLNDISATKDGFYFKYVGRTSAYDGLYKYINEGHNCAGGSSGAMYRSLLPLQKSASVLYYSPWSDPTNLSYIVIDSNQKDNDLSVEFSPDGGTIFLKYSICEENIGYTEYCVFDFLDYQYSDSNPEEVYVTMLLMKDSDGDMFTDLNDELPFEPTQHSDKDGDGYGDDQNGNYPDSCSSIFGNSTLDRFGCPDIDGDGWSNLGDALPSDATQFQDLDGDGFGDNSQGNRPDTCPQEYGTSFRENILGCEDKDGDGYADTIDDFVNDSSQHLDSDGDGYGDSFIGFQGDACPDIFGNSTNDRFGCLDSDGDGYSDLFDDFPYDSDKWADFDGDGIEDDVDEFPYDPTQSSDSDGDGYGDNPYGSQGDHFPNDPSKWADRDGDGVTDSEDAFPDEASQNSDFDGDGYGDNPIGVRPDAFPEDVTEWNDLDGDGTGDNSDAFRFDATQNSDRDGDGWGDNEFGNKADAFPDDPTQWEDSDGDGLGDNQSGNNPDPSLNDFDNDGYIDSEDVLPLYSSPGDLDADGCLDEDDAFPSNKDECTDTDGDGEGDNSDVDDDNDGWSDNEEVRQGTDPLSSSDVPVESFEIQIGTIGLSAWDLIGIFGGVPLFGWICFGLVTRTARTEKFTQDAKDAKNRVELEKVAERWEFALMLRLIGPHQGIRLERLRAELDDEFEKQESEIFGEKELPEIDQTNLLEINSPSRDMEGVIDGDGYHWLEHNGVQFYRSSYEEDWIEWSS